FAFIPISIAALAGVAEHQAGLASGLLNTSQQIGGAIGIAIASTVAASHTQALLHAGHAAPAALTGGFQAAFLVLGAIGLTAVPAIFALVRHDELSDAVAKTTVREPQPAPAGAKGLAPTPIRNPREQRRPTMSTSTANVAEVRPSGVTHSSKEASMHAVVLNVTVTDADAAAAALRDQVVPQVSGTPGFVAGYW